MSKQEKILTNVIKQDSYDKILWDSVRDNASEVGKLATQDEQVDALVSDVFSSLYKVSPEITESAPHPQKNLIETMTNLPEYKTLREMTRLDEISSAFGTMKLGPDAVKQFIEVQKKVNQQRKQQGKPEVSDQNPIQGDEITEEMQGQMRRAFRKSVEQAQNDAEDWQDAMVGWGINPGEIQRLPFKQKFELAERLMSSHKFKQISEIAGRFKSMALSAAATTPSHGFDEVVDIIQGDDLFRALPHELLKLKRTPALFMKDLVEKKLLNYNLRGVENVGCGPIIVCMDISGSMSGQREIWAKSVIIALIALAEKQNRSFGILTFDTKVRYRKFFSKDNKPSINDKIDIAEIHCDGGGTDFYPVLKSAFKMRQEEIQQLNPSDIVFITDGESRMSKEQMDEIKKLKLETNVRILGVGISDSSHYDTCSGDTLDEFSDNMSIVDSLGNVEHVKGVFAKVAPKTKG